MIDDAMLLRRYAHEDSEEAFTEFVRRHLDLVYSAALRRTNGDAHHAADIAQVVFSAAARDASTLAKRPVLTGWLFTATRNAALNVLRAERRRRAHEQEVYLMHELVSPSVHDAEWRQLRPVLDAAIDHLAEREREAVLLRFFEQRSFAEIGTALRVSQDAARMRVERALDKLHAQLAKRGIRSTSAALGAVLVHGAVAAAPTGLAGSLAAAVLSGAAGGATMVGAGSMTAAWNFMAASKLTISLAAAGALATAFTVYQLSQARAIAIEVDRASGHHAALTARMSSLQADVNAAEQTRTSLDLQFERARIEKAAEASAAKARQLAAEEQMKQQEKALKQFLDNDPELLKLRYDRNMAGARAWAVSRLGVSSPEKLELVARKNADLAELDEAKVLAGIAPEMPKIGHQREPETIAKDLVPRLFYFMDEPYTLEDASRLQAFLASAWLTNEAANLNIYAKFGWDRIITQAGEFLSPTQLQGLRGMAGWGRNSTMRAEVAKQDATLEK